MNYSYSEFINGLINLGYKFFVSPEGSTIIIEVSFDQSYFIDGDEIVPPKELPQFPYKTIVRRDDYGDETCDKLYIVFIWEFELNEWPVEPPRQ